MSDDFGQVYEDSTMSLLLDYILLGVHLEVAAPLVRDSFVQNALQQDASDDEKMVTIAYLMKVTNEQADVLRQMSRDDFEATLMARAVMELLS